MAKEELGMKITLEADAKNLQQELRNLKSDLTSIDKQGRSLKNALKFDSSNAETYAKVIDNLKQRQKTLNDTMSTAQQRVEKLSSLQVIAKQKVEDLTKKYQDEEKELQTLKDKYGSNSDEVKKYAEQHDKTKKKLDAAVSNEEKLAKAVDSTQKKYEESSAELTKTTAELKKYEEGAKDAGNQSVNSAEKMSRISDQADAMNVAIGNLVAQGIRKAIDGFKQLASSVVEAGSGFEDGMKGLAAILQVDSNDYVIKDLADYFEELGTQSKYSATEIANNAQVLANAGYESNEIKDSIKVIGDLAAGTGESFDEMSSIVVDGLAAFGMKSSEAAHFADVLAKAAISSNTNVSMMGEAFKYVGSIAGTLGYSVEDVGVALGAMANQGIKASTAGTTLRSIFTRLAANTSGARDALEELGISFFDANGKARELVGSLGPDGLAGTEDDTVGVLDELREAMAGMNDEQKTTLEYTIAGQRGLSGLAAIVNTSSDKWNGLKKEVNEYNGTVSQMAETRLDSYSGDVALLKNNWQAVATTMYQEVEPSLRKIMQSGTKLLQSDFFKKDMVKLADGVADKLEIISKIISALNPKIIGMGTSTLKAVATIGATTKGLTALSKVIPSVAGSVLSLGKTSLSVYDALFSSTTVAGKFTSAIKIMGTSLPTTIAGVGLLAGALVGITSGLKAAQEEHMKEMDALYGLNDATRETVDNMNELTDSYNTLKESTASNAAEINTQYSYYQQLAEEYDSIMAKNDQMTDQDKQRADTILTVLAEAFGVEKSQIQDLITEHGNLSSAIQDTIEKKKADALLSVYQDQYAQSIKTVTEAQQEQNTLLSQRNEQQEKVNQLAQEADSIYAQLKDTTGLTASQTKELSDKYSDVLGKLSYAQGALGETDDALNSNKQVIEDCQATITNYEQLVGAAASGSASDIESATARITNSFKTADNASYDSLVKQKNNIYDQWQSAKTEYENGSSTVTKSQVEMWHNLYKTSVQEVQKAKKTGKDYGKYLGEGGAEGAKESQKSFERSTRLVMRAGDNAAAEEAGINSPSRVWYQYGIYMGQGAINGMNAMQYQVANAAARLADAANSAYRNRLKIHSPSRVMEENGMFTGEGIVVGLDNQIPEIAKKGKELADKLNESVQGYINAGSLNNVTNQSYDQSTYSPTYSIQIVQRNGEDATALAKRVSEMINNDYKRDRAVWQ